MSIVSIVVLENFKLERTDEGAANFPGDRAAPDVHIDPGRDARDANLAVVFNQGAGWFTAQPFNTEGHRPCARHRRRRGSRGWRG